MTDKEAIETMQHWIDYEKANKEKINKADELIEIQETVVNLIQTKQEEIKKKDNIIDEAIDWIKSLHDSLIEEYGTYETEFSINGDNVEENKIKEYFTKKVEKENKDENN